MQHLRNKSSQGLVADGDPLRLLSAVSVGLAMGAAA
jgi:hypothetical protein